MSKKFDFAKSYEKLEKITDEFESGKLSLEQGLEKFEEGLALASECKKYLEEVENKIIDIKKKFNVSDAS
ncbi:exodeoxyribonuclease VII small subunit [Candidatus Azambacteria bacterium RIFCSPHIGHO2_02_FULL_52_12]|uniref:Exodeoxyribonuclease 7 small subunit n=1 Tax=Candidatus Azambacteria bacterium RIFCSPLOWO2_01_FULL_46_25 TaxID=1797298 RepID=A0A1F5BTV1_9BACT|nr:MAG: exodeoxyribonuclease VII small subunit [Candidatus Azambacteria bacterium RIFCSPHIGHO2_02_FULL_52_12]OGD34020.1 MAG: exodeoxyribonuclease VII small subunit [Candidatus Azambacteria bacterium RIFCSPLOWO2_01_FULL_46_25]OGD36559.1 MAG: exodeoxyribonuclease VII small subunit [Candidatus Azambacteria bacterium RIFCSPHIGHO2_01_FULL_51_74]